MKFSFRTGSLLAGLLVTLSGCDTSETKMETEPKVVTPAVTPGPEAPTPPVIPSTVPALPEVTKPDMKVEEPVVPKTEEPKLEPPK